MINSLFGRVFLSTYMRECNILEVRGLGHSPGVLNISQATYNNLLIICPYAIKRFDFPMNQNTKYQMFLNFKIIRENFKSMCDKS